MNKRFGLLILYALLISGVLNASFRVPIENTITILVVWFSVLTALLVFIIRRRRRNR